jgi:hypothetical protein
MALAAKCSLQLGRPVKLAEAYALASQALVKEGMQ